MDWTQPVSLNLENDPGRPWRRLLLFFGHYDCRVYLSAAGYVDVGAGSLDYCRRITQAPDGHKGSLGTIGRHCEVALSVEINCAGEHANERPINVGFSQVPMLVQILQRQGAQDGLSGPVPIDIGNAVVISASVFVLAGSAIGDGAVIGANSVVNGTIAPFSVAAGSPARHIRFRLNDEQQAQVRATRWWDFDVAYMAEHAATLQQLALSPGPHRYREPRPRFVFALQAGEVMKFVGVAAGEGIDPLEKAPDKVQAYVRQAYGAGPHYWLADCWA